jgi:hypothetical protein
MINSFLNSYVHPLVVGTIGEAGIVATSSIPNETLSIVLQIIIASTTLLKLWVDYKNGKRTTKETDKEDLNG